MMCPEYSAMSKTCFKCSTDQPLSEFYRHRMMADGHLGKCKTCTKRDVAEHRALNLDKIHEYDIKRFQDPERKAKIKVYQSRMDPVKKKARVALNNAVRDGRVIKPSTCGQCGMAGKIEAHHHDYSKPFDVQWMCFQCHRAIGHGQKVTTSIY